MQVAGRTSWARQRLRHSSLPVVSYYRPTSQGGFHPKTGPGWSIRRKWRVAPTLTSTCTTCGAPPSKAERTAPNSSNVSGIIEKNVLKKFCLEISMPINSYIQRSLISTFSEWRWGHPLRTVVYYNNNSSINPLCKIIYSWAKVMSPYFNSVWSASRLGFSEALWDDLRETVSRHGPLHTWSYH